MTMDKKFEIGDRVRSKFYGVVGTIMEIDTDGYILKPDTDDDMWIADTDVEPYDPKTAFLSDLAAVLRKHNAVINVGWNDYFDTDKSPRIDMDIMFADSNKGICLEDVLGKSLTADNIMDYDKE